MSATTKQETVIALANKIVAVQVSYTCAFEFDGEQFRSRSVDQAMHERERAFADKDCDLAEHLAKVTAFLIKRRRRFTLVCGRASSPES